MDKWREKKEKERKMVRNMVRNQFRVEMKGANMRGNMIKIKTKLS
jgi:hypothetical protein